MVGWNGYGKFPIQHQEAFRTSNPHDMADREIDPLLDLLGSCSVEKELRKAISVLTAILGSYNGLYGVNHPRYDEAIFALALGGTKLFRLEVWRQAISELYAVFLKDQRATGGIQYSLEEFEKLDHSFSGGKVATECLAAIEHMLDFETSDIRVWLVYCRQTYRGLGWSEDFWNHSLSRLEGMWFYRPPIPVEQGRLARQQQAAVRADIRVFLQNLDPVMAVDLDVADFDQWLAQRDLEEDSDSLPDLVGDSDLEEFDDFNVHDLD